ncbi:ATPase [Brevibacillus fluminis]|uniref:ATPase n=1 Tax=Brevibacillus fluminis TaxID=511487 RepID=A0A3M8DHP2_9BACL|nr:BadF/BadG/BcrA/BcrD ATPase family protein [Brevibacillus fluminis]RNB86991.1 ATPase [Brevibacillus fluminis]
MRVVAGIDGGGTKTECMLACLKTGKTVTVTGAGCNPLITGYERLAQTVRALLEEALREMALSFGAIQAICLGVAGAGRPQEQEQVDTAVRAMLAKEGIGPNVPCLVLHDADIALRGALAPEQKAGIIAIAGTGSVAYGVDAGGKRYRSGGWGHLLGDEGSGYAIGLAGLQAVCRAYDRRGEQTLLTRTVLELCQLADPQELIPYLYTNSLEKSEIARFAKLVIEAAEARDHVSIGILTKAADELILHIESLRVQMQGHADGEEHYPVVVAGSIFAHSPFIKERFAEQITVRKLGVFQEPYGSPVEGAVRIAKELAGADGGEETEHA